MRRFRREKHFKTFGPARSMVSILFLLTLFSLSLPAHGEQIILDSDEEFRYARALMEKGAYDQAVIEFRRFIHFFSHDSRLPRARYWIGVCYLETRKFEDSREAFSEVLDAHPRDPIAAKALFMMGESYYRQGLSKEAETYFSQVVETYPHTELKNVALYRLGWVKMKSGQWRKASGIFRAVDRESPLYAQSQELAEKGLGGERLPHKSPKWAGALAVVPGLGHAYVGRYRDASIAFVLNGLFIWAAVQAFQSDQVVLGGILTFLEVGWYGGNLYSAVNVAHKHNRRMKEKFLRGLGERLDIRPFLGRNGQAGIVLGFRF